jgi:hypothetical protein
MCPHAGFAAEVAYTSFTVRLRARRDGGPAARTARSNYRVTEPIETNWALLDDGGHGGLGWTLLCSSRGKGVRTIGRETKL